jgi:hypothetical protein
MRDHRPYAICACLAFLLAAVTATGLLAGALASGYQLPAGHTASSGD